MKPPVTSTAHLWELEAHLRFKRLSSVVRRLSSLIHHSSLLPTLAAVLLTLPSLAAGLQFDDYHHRDVLLGGSPATAARSLFTFLDGDPARAQALMDSGVFPWWTLPTAREAFWRPLAALTHWLDYQLWPHSPAAMHAHSLLWFGVLVAAAAALYRRLGPTPAAAAGLAALLYALDDAHGFAAGWLANRNGLLAALFGVLCVHAYVRWRRDVWRPGAVLAPLWLALGLLSAEAALGAVAYLAAYAVCLDRAPWRRRLESLLPVALVVLAWAVVYRALGYGAWGTAYVDPLQEPAAFARAVLERGPVLLLAQFAGPPAELYPFLGPAPRLVLWLTAGLVLTGLAWLCLPLLRRSPTARFWAIGLLLALLPICAALPANRLLFFVGLGAMGLLAEWLLLGRSVISRQGSAKQASVVGRLSSVVLVSIHLVLAPLLLPITASSPRLLGHLEPAALSLSVDTDDTVVLLNAPSFFSASFLGSIRAAHGLPVPARVRYLGAGPAALEVTRPDAGTLVVTPAGGYLTGFDSVFRGPHHPLALGQIIALDGVTVTVQSLTTDGRPSTAAFRFDVPLEDATLRWFEWRGGVFVPFALPPVGETLTVPPLQLFTLDAAP